MFFLTNHDKRPFRVDASIIQWSCFLVADYVLYSCAANFKSNDIAEEALLYKAQVTCQLSNNFQRGINSFFRNCVFRLPSTSYSSVFCNFLNLLQATGEAQEVFSMRQGPVKTACLLPPPPPSGADMVNARFCFPAKLLFLCCEYFVK